MFKTVVYKKINFTKNASENGGAMNQVLENLKENEICVHVQNQKSGRMWGATTPDHLLKIIDKNIGAYEVISKFPHKAFFDIDCEDGTQLEVFKKIIKKRIPDAQLSISGSETATKNSYHITMNNYVITNTIDRENFKHFVIGLHSENKGFDTKVYTNNRNMKIINQSKQNDPRVQQIIEDNTPQNHLITCFIDPLATSVSLFASSAASKKVEQKTQKNKRLNILDLPAADVNPNFDKNNLNNPLVLLNLLPISTDFEHKYTFMVARFCFSNGLSFHQFWDWYRAKNDSDEKKEKWVRQWDYIDDFPPVTVKQLMFVLEKYYPSITKQKELLAFMQICDISDVDYTEVEKIDQSHFETDKKTIIFNVGMGGGKTTQTVDYLRRTCNGEDDKENFVWMTPNIALADNTFERMKDFHHTNLYNEEKKKEKKQDLIEKSKNLMICMNSLKYATDKQYKVVVIDEVETFLKKWCFNETLDGVQKVCYENFILILKKAEKIILLDAFVTKITIDFLTNLGISFTLVKRKDDKSYNNRDAIKFNKSKHMVIDIIKKLKEGKKILIFYPYCKGNNTNQSMDSLRQLLEKHTEKHGICHNSMTSDKIKRKLKDVNNEWVNYDFVMSNNVITVGVNFDVLHFDQCYLFIANFNEVRDIAQFSYRPRNLNDNVIKYCFIAGYRKADDDDKLDKKSEVDSPEYKHLRDMVFIENTSPKVETFNQFLFMAGYHILPDEAEIEKRELDELEIIKSSETYYDYDCIEEIDDDLLRDYETEFYSNNCSMKVKLMLRKYHFDKHFKGESDSSVRAEIWNGNYIKLVDDVKYLLTGSDKLMEKLKDDYKWELHFPEQIQDFKFDKSMLKSIFDSGFCSRKLTEESSHKLIIKSYINHYFNSEVIKGVRDDKSHTHSRFVVNDKFKRIYILIKESVYIRPKVFEADVDFF